MARWEFYGSTHHPRRVICGRTKTCRFGSGSVFDQNEHGEGGESLFMFSDRELNLKPRWFTGEEWANGTAERESRQEYYEAVEAKKRSNARRDDRPQIEDRFRNVAGLPPSLACKRLMGRR